MMNLTIVTTVDKVYGASVIDESHRNVQVGLCAETPLNLNAIFI
jgi:hypothetical protein